jgi:hypothetical protein
VIIIVSKKLNNLPQELRILVCHTNYLTTLNNLPPNLEILCCNYNKINFIDNSLLNCRNLHTLSYSINPIELTQQQLNFIQWQKHRNNNNYYNNTQNVHNSTLQKSLLRCIQNLLK